jgi:RNA polymerase primary sigma factor
MGKVNNDLKASTSAFVNLKNYEYLNMFIKDIMKEKPLSGKEEKELFLRYKNSTDEQEKSKIREEIIMRNQRFVYAVAKRYVQDDTMLDLISEGNLGLIEAFDTYDVDSGNRFCTYAVWYIRRAINAYITTGNMIIKKSNGLKTGNKTVELQNAFMAQEGRMPTEDELIDLYKEKYNIKIKNPADLYELRIDSINTCYDDENGSAFENSKEFMSHAYVDSEETYNTEDNYISTMLEYFITYLSDRESNVIRMAYGINDEHKDYTNEEISQHLGVSVERVRQIKKGAIEKMKEHVSEVKRI